MSLWNGEFKLIKPMLAFSASLDDSKKFLNEIKYDGTRCIAYIDKERRKFWFLNRRMNFFQNKYPEMTSIFDSINANKVILDGELAIVYKNKTDFYKLQEREQTDNELRIGILASMYPATYFVFDILYKDKKDLVNLPLIERKSILEDTVLNGANIEKTKYIIGNASLLFKEAKKRHLEGIMQKEIDSPYMQERSKYWRKVKFTSTYDCAIIGYTAGEGEREELGALLLGLYKDNTLYYVGKVGTGFNEQEINTIKNVLDKIKVKDLEVKNKEDIKEKKAIFVKPALVCEVKFASITPDNKLRAPSFIRLRQDKEPKECTFSQ